MPAIAEGSIAISIEAMAAYLSLCPTLQAGRTPAATLAASIDWGYRETDESLRKPARPFAVVDVTGQHSYRLDSGGAQNNLRPSGAIWLWLERDWNSDYLDDPLNARRDAATWFGQVIDELANLAGRDIGDILPPFSDGGASLSIIDISQELFATIDPDDTPDEELFFLAGYTVQWGDG